jgi:RNA polymerase sigma-70 factor (ECF subfamily)
VDQRGILERAKHGDEDAFAALVNVHLARLDATARLVLRDPELARDAVQECLIRAWRDLSGLRDPDRLEAWLYRLTVNACFDLIRQRRRRPIEVELVVADAPVTPDYSHALAESELIHRALGRLDPGHRAVVALHFLVGMTLTEVATTLRIPVGTVKSRLNNSLRVMRTTVPPSDDTASAPVPGGQLA